MITTRIVLCIGLLCGLYICCQAKSYYKRSSDKKRSIFSEESSVSNGSTESTKPSGIDRSFTTIPGMKAGASFKVTKPSKLDQLSKLPPGPSGSSEPMTTPGGKFQAITMPGVKIQTKTTPDKEDNSQTTQASPPQGREPLTPAPPVPDPEDQPPTKPKSNKFIKFIKWIFHSMMKSILFPITAPAKVIEAPAKLPYDAAKDTVKVGEGSMKMIKKVA